MNCCTSRTIQQQYASPENALSYSILYQFYRTSLEAGGSPPRRLVLYDYGSPPILGSSPMANI